MSSCSSRMVHCPVDSKPHDDNFGESAAVAPTVWGRVYGSDLTESSDDR